MSETGKKAFWFVRRLVKPIETLAEKKEGGILSLSLLYSTKRFTCHPCRASLRGDLASPVRLGWQRGKVHRFHLWASVPSHAVCNRPVSFIIFPAIIVHIKNFYRARFSLFALLQSLPSDMPKRFKRFATVETSRNVTAYRDALSKRLGKAQAFSKRFKRFDFLNPSRISGPACSVSPCGPACPPWEEPR